MKILQKNEITSEEKIILWNFFRVDLNWHLDDGYYAAQINHFGSLDGTQSFVHNNFNMHMQIAHYLHEFPFASLIVLYFTSYMFHD